MTTSDYEIHINRESFDSLWDKEDESEAFPFGEDMDLINKIINEEIGPTRRSKRKKVNTK